MCTCRDRFQNVEAKALIIPCDPWGVVGSRGDQAMVLACLQHVRAARPDRVVDVLTDSHDTDAPCRELGLNPVVAWREPLDVWFAAHACNYLRDGVHLGLKGPYFLAEVADYPNSDSYYGCRQMGGKAWEWIEPVGPSKLNLRGGSFGYTEFGMGIWNRDEAGLADELSVFGLRLARVVEGGAIVRPTCRARLCCFLDDLSIRQLFLWLFVLMGACLFIGWIVG